MTDRRYRAACRDEDPELFFPIGNQGQATQDQIDKAKAVCWRCPVRMACLQWAFDTGEDAGVWGGWTAAERREFRRTGHRVDDTARPGVDEERVAALMRGARIRSTRADKREAARRLFASGKTKTEITRLLRTAGSTLNTFLAPQGVDVSRVG